MSRAMPAAGVHDVRNQRRLLIVHASAELYGADRACVVLARAAVASGLRVSVLLPANGPLVEVCQESGARVVVGRCLVLRRASLHGWRLPLALGDGLRTLAWLIRFSRRERFDLVHSNCMPTLGGLVLSRIWRVPHVWQVHEILPSAWLGRTFFQLALRTADIVLTCSASVRTQFTSAELRAKCRVAYTGADVPPGIEEVAVLSRQRAELICVGRLNQWKGQSVAVEALARLKASGRSAHLKIVGGVYAGQNKFRLRLLEQIDQLGLSDEVVLTGDRSDALELVAQADIVLAPAVKPEPFGIAIVEAMALGRPVVATNQGGPTEIIRNGIDGLLVPPGDSEALATMVRRLMDDPARARNMGDRARERARQFPQELMVRTTFDAYKSVAEFRPVTTDSGLGSPEMPSGEDPGRAVPSPGKQEASYHA